MEELGGAQIHVFDLAKALKKDGHDVIVLGAGSSVLTEELIAYGITYIPLKHLVVGVKPFYDIRAIFETHQVIKKLKPDLLAVHSSKAGIIGRLTAKSLRIPTVFTVHGWSFSGELGYREMLYTFLEKWMSRLTEDVITVSNYDYNLALNNKIISAENMRVIHNGIPDDERCSLTKPYDSVTVKLLMIARFAEPKDQKLLLKALSQVSLKNWHLTFVGDGPLLEENKLFSEELGIRNKVVFAGQQKNVIDWLASANIFLLISKSEGLPISIIEAMREGLPIIASKVGGNEELIKHKQQGYLVQSESEKELISALERMISDAGLRRDFGESARQRFQKHFIFQVMYEETVDYYNEIVGF